MTETFLSVRLSEAEVC